MIQVKTRSPEETRALGEALGAALNAPVTFALSGDLGSGKTVFVQGLAAGLGIRSENEVASPSFSLVHEHRGRLLLYHVDLYRLERAIELEDLGLDEFMDGRAVVAVEWGEKLPAYRLADHLRVRFEIVSDTERVISLEPRGEAAVTVLKRAGILKGKK